MPEWLGASLLVTAALSGYLALVAFLTRIRKGMFRVRRTGPQRVEIETDAGAFAWTPRRKS